MTTINRDHLGPVDMFQRGTQSPPTTYPDFPEFYYESEEWDFGDFLISGGIRLTLSADPRIDIVDGIQLEAVRYTADALCFPRRVPVPLCDLMKSWVATHQSELETARRRHFAEAAE